MSCPFGMLVREGSPPCDEVAQKQLPPTRLEICEEHIVGMPLTVQILVCLQ